MPLNNPDNAKKTGAEGIELAAAEWLVRQDRGLDLAQRQAFARWLQAAKHHAVVYAELKATWGMLDHVPLTHLPVPPRRARSMAWVTGSLAAMAAAVTLVLLPDETTHPLRQHAPAGVAATPVGGLERFVLADGSVVRLNTASEIAVDFSEHERRVKLTRGEVSFDVAKNHSRPFVVRVGGVDVRAVGTAFNVRRRDTAIDVLVTEGRVRLDDAASGQNLLIPTVALLPADSSLVRLPPESISRQDETNEVALLGAGQRATIVLASRTAPARASIANIPPSEAGRVLAWHTRQLDFDAEPLANIAAEFNRYNRHHLVIADEKLGAQKFGGRFPADDFNSLVRLLEMNFDVIVERRANETIVRRASANR